MPVIVFNKRTGKYLRRHSGSYRNKWSALKYKHDVSKEIIKRFGHSLPWNKDKEAYSMYHLKVAEFLKDMVCNAEPGDARVYFSEASAISSVGDWGRGTVSSKCHLPDYLEIHEIKESFMCVMRPDGSSNCDDEEVK